MVYQVDGTGYNVAELCKLDSVSTGLSNCFGSDLQYSPLFHPSLFSVQFDSLAFSKSIPSIDQSR